MKSFSEKVWSGPTRLKRDLQTGFKKIIKLNNDSKAYFRTDFKPVFETDFKADVVTNLKPDLHHLTSVACACKYCLFF